MLIAGGVYVEKCVAPETTQLLGSGGRAALALSGVRDEITLHTFHPPNLWEDLRANFAPYGIDVAAHPSAERVTFSYLFPLGRPVQTPARTRHAGQIVVEGEEILCFGCVEGCFIIRGGAVVQDVQGATDKVRATGSKADRLALVLNLQEAMIATGRDTGREAAASLLQGEGADVVVIKDGPRGATVFDASSSEWWIPPYSSSRLYKIGSGDVFSAAFADWWLRGCPAAQAADRASRQTAAYVEAPVLPLLPLWPSSHLACPRAVEPPTAVYVVAPLTSLAQRWFAVVVEEALLHIGVADVRPIDIDLWLAGRRPALNSDDAVLLCPGNARQTEAALREVAPTPARQVIFLERSSASIEPPMPVVADLSQALYELCWRPS